MYINNQPLIQNTKVKEKGCKLCGYYYCDYFCVCVCVLRMTMSTFPGPHVRALAALEIGVMHRYLTKKKFQLRKIHSNVSYNCKYFVL